MSGKMVHSTLLPSKGGIGIRLNNANDTFSSNICVSNIQSGSAMTGRRCVPKKNSPRDQHLQKLSEE
jgi:hypothetical protein